jgi:hypothetical protein
LEINFKKILTFKIDEFMKKILVSLTIALALFGLSNAVNAQYCKLLDFNATNGFFPNGSLTVSGSVLCGMTYWGGAKG